METTDVIICGLGNIVLEKELEITQDPRGIALDEDGIRMLQGAGVYDKIFTEIGESTSTDFQRYEDECANQGWILEMGYFNFVSGSNNLHATPFRRFNYNTVEGGTSHPGFACHKQPVLERCLRDAIEQHSKSEIRPGSTVQSISDDRVFKYEATWVALNWRITPPTPESYPDFPLWRLGYTPDQPGEDGYEIANLSKDLAFPEDCIEVIRSRPFTFSARSCNKWSLGRVLLCGDAAHVFPPFGSQGIASGFRDAASLAWRFTVACRPNFHGHEKLFEAWYMERKQQLEKSLTATIVNRNLCNERSLVKIFLRDWFLWSLQLIPSWRHWLELGQRQEGLTKYAWSPGMPFLPGLGGGKIFPRVFYDVIFGKEKTALFPHDLVDLEKEQQGELRVEEATYFIDEPSFTACTQTSQGIAYRILHMDLSNPSIWGGLPRLGHWIWVYPWISG
ncbi:FAD/NAD(P)-binding domain containing protein [Hyaloscypha variabilis]